MIIALTLEDVKNISKDMGDSFYSEAGFPGGFNIEAFLFNWTKLIEANIGVMWKVVLDNKSVAFLGGILMPDINNGDLVATELFWYVHPQHRKGFWGIRLFLTFENWAKSMGAKRITMAHLINKEAETLKKFYQRRGYSPLEIHYVKHLT